MDVQKKVRGSDESSPGLPFSTSRIDWSMQFIKQQFGSYPTKNRDTRIKKKNNSASDNYDNHQLESRTNTFGKPRHSNLLIIRIQHCHRHQGQIFNSLAPWPSKGCPQKFWHKWLKDSSVQKKTFQFALPSVRYSFPIKNKPGYESSNKNKTHKFLNKSDPPAI